MVTLSYFNHFLSKTIENNHIKPIKFVIPPFSQLFMIFIYVLITTFEHLDNTSHYVTIIMYYTTFFHYTYFLQGVCLEVMQPSSIVKWEKRIRISIAMIFAILMILNIYISEKFKTDFVFFQTLIMYILLFFQMGFNLLQFLSQTTNKYIQMTMILLYTYAYISNFIVLLILLISPIDSMLVLTMVLTFFTLSVMFLTIVEHQFKKRIKKRAKNSNKISNH